MPADPAAPRSPSGAGPTHKETIKETLVSIIIAFVLAFVFRGFVIEAFVIPTGSMAPTLMGAHMRFRGPESGYTWPVGPWQDVPGAPGEYMPVQTGVAVHDPMTGQRVEKQEVARRSGDRILVLKFLYGLREPQRFDVVVFKCPYDPATNFIKRLIGLPGEQVALVDGDVFVRSAANSAPEVAPEEQWTLPGWHIARKPARVQDAVWQPVFDSRYAPLNPIRDGRPWYNPPWVGSTAGWKVDGPIYAYDGPGPTQLEWDRTRVRYGDARPPWGSRPPETWDIDDRYPYDEHPLQSSWVTRYPVSDVRVRAGIEPASDGLETTVTVAARNHEFEAVVRGNTATIRMRGSAGSTSPSPAWSVLGTATIDPLPAGKVTDVEFWHVDQSVSLWIAGKRALWAEYDWSIAERIRNSTGKELGAILAEERAVASRSGHNRPLGNILANPGDTQRPQVRWSFSGGGLRMHRVGLDRDLHYQPSMFGPGPLAGSPALATHPASTVSLNKDEYFVCGDNSPASKDGRLWDDVDPWVEMIDRKPGVVPRDLMLGKAFFVYFPSLHRDGTVPVPDFGRLRFIR